MRLAGERGAPLNLPHWKQTLERAGLSFVEGLTPDQLRDCERLHNVRFPPDLEEMLRFALPVGKGCPDWRNPSDPAIAEMFARPLDGILFDIEQNAFWPRELGERPSDLNAAFRLITAWIDAAPKLIPVMGHRYLPDRAHDVTAAISPSRGLVGIDLTSVISPPCDAA